MKKLILISGKIGSGKTTLLHKMVADDVLTTQGGYNCLLDFNLFTEKEWERVPIQIFNCIGLDNVYYLEDFKMIFEIYSLMFEGLLIVASPIPKDEIPEKILKRFEVIDVDYPNKLFHKLPTVNSLINEVRTAFADYERAEGCTCCRDMEGHEEAGNRLGRLLDAKQNEDGSGFDWSLYRSK